LKKSVNELPFLVAQMGPLIGRKWAITAELLIGRGEDCDIVIPDRQVSRFHLKLIPHIDNPVEIKDLGSKNGSFLNGKKVNESAYIKDGDQIKIALVQNFIFVSSDSTVPLGNAKKASGRLLIDSRARRVWVLEREVIPALSVQQFHLLQSLYEQSGEVVSREKIVQAVWGLKEGEGVTEQALDALVRRLRERLSEFDKKHNYLVTARGFGIRLDNPDYE
jgi:DNA-binding winged helix-turn-helix (wHTH) protein